MRFDIAYKILFNGSFDFCGTVNRSAGYSDKPHFDPHFHKYLIQNEETYPTGYLHASANMRAELNSVAKYAKQQPVDIDQRAWSFARNSMFKHFFPVMCNSDEITIDLAWQDMAHTTSAGYPWSLKFSDKNALINTIGFEMCEQYYVGLIDGSSWRPVWTDSVKEENRSMDKVLSNNLRTFCASPIEHCLACKRICGDMNNKFYRAGRAQQGGFWSAVGMSKFYRGWHKLAMRLTRDGKLQKGLALDVSQYDSSLFRALFIELIKFRCDCLKRHESKLRLWTLYREIIDSVMVLVNGLLVEKQTGNPSGSENTVVDNTIILYFLLAYLYAVQWFRSGQEIDSLTYGQFSDDIEAALYGDDNTFFATVSCWNWFKPELIPPVMLALGYKVTAEHDDWTPRPLDELTFLSHRFRYVDAYSLWVPVPVAGRILCSLLYGSSIPDIRWTLMRAYMLLIEAWWHDRVRVELFSFISWVYEHYRSKLVDGPIAQGVSFSSVRGLMKSPGEITALYISHEERNSIKACHDHPPCFKCIQ